ncbi:MAG: TlpA family protein disulfide reductase [Akkermansiaceae bacterium]
MTGFRLLIVFVAFYVASNGQLKSESTATPEEVAIEQILSIRESPEAFEKAVNLAREANVSEQAILEARFLFHVDRLEDEKVVELLPSFLAKKGNFNLEDSAIFAAEDDWLAVVEYVQALSAKQNDDFVGFKRHITEAFWLSPQQGAAFAPHIQNMRLVEAMKSVQVDLEKKYQNLLEGDSISLGGVLEKQKATLLHFWSPGSPESEATLPDFLTTASYLSKNEIGVISILPEVSKDVIVAAREYLGREEINSSCEWIVDEEKKRLAEVLKVTTLPTVVLVSKEGKVLYNGHPASKEFWDALGKVDLSIVRPEVRAIED